MNLIKKNIIANYFGSIWQGLMSLIFIPLYIKFMGIESYGLVGIFATLLAMFAILDMGLSATLTREMARLSALADKEQEMRDLTRSLETIYWLIAILIGIVIIAISPFIARHWIRAGQLSSKSVELALQIMGLSMALQWPVSFYSGGLVGLQKQVLLNVINVSVSTLRGVGAVLILWLISPTIQAFFLWQIIISIINTGILSFSLWHELPFSSRKAIFQKRLIYGVWRFAAGISGISILVIILTQIDKIILSKMLTLEMFGYYTLAGAVGMSLYRLISPVFSAIYPRFTQLVSLSDQGELRRIYHKSCQFMSVLILPITIIVAMFSYEIMLIWTQSPVIAEKTHILVSILVCGSALNGLMNVPYALQLAYGWTSLALFTNLISIIILVPLVVFMTRQYGSVGGASVWAILNGGYVIFAIHFMHRRLLPSEKWCWYWQDTGIPFVTSFIIAGLFRLFTHNQTSYFIIVLQLVFCSVIVFISVAMVTQTTRDWVLNKLLKLKLV
jgi:O-antigen/teichoic acid export membrane protein